MAELGFAQLPLHQPDERISVGHQLHRLDRGAGSHLSGAGPGFYAELVALAGAGEVVQQQAQDATGQTLQAEHWAQLFAQRTRDEWCALLEGADACFAPVLELEEARQHPHMASRGTYQQIDGVLHSAPAPRFSRTASGIRPSIQLDPEADVWSERL